MIELTGETLVSAIAIKISETFTTTELSNIYKNKPIQGMKVPCAFIHQINVVDQNQMRTTGNRTYLLDVRVHPPEREQRTYTWLNNTGEKLKGALNQIQVSEKPERKSVV